MQILSKPETISINAFLWVLSFQAGLSFCERTNHLFTQSIRSDLETIVQNRRVATSGPLQNTKARPSSKGQFMRRPFTFCGVFSFFHFFSYNDKKWRPFFVYFSNKFARMNHFIAMKNNDRFQITYQLSLLHIFFKLKLRSRHSDPSSILFRKKGRAPVHRWDNPWTH